MQSKKLQRLELDEFGRAASRAGWTSNSLGAEFGDSATDQREAVGVGLRQLHGRESSEGDGRPLNTEGTLPWVT